ncbi:hypothetical protein GOV08_04635 [Candidatus Woesearchaeota archaeon]|nr:hypothetical protein [Candidatus Woesearchaeota archaeon]
MAFLTVVLIFLLAMIISALPLYFAVKLFGGKATILKVLFVNLIAGIVIGSIKLAIGLFGGLLAFIVLLLIYKYMFGLGFLRAFFVWIMQFVIAAILLIIAMFSFGVSLVL